MGTLQKIDVIVNAFNGGFQLAALETLFDIVSFYGFTLLSVHFIYFFSYI